PPAPERLRRAVRQCRRRPRLRRVHLQLPRRRLHAAERRARERLPARAGDPRRALPLRDPGEPDHGPAQPPPRPEAARELMSQLDPTVLELPAAAPIVPRRNRLHLPGWLVLLLCNPKSRTGFAIVGFMVLVAL